MGYILEHIQNLFHTYPWLNFWRGGTYKKAMGLPSENNVADIGKKGEPMALVDSPYINREAPNYYHYGYN